MSIFDKTKELGQKTVDLGVKAGKKGVEVGKKGVDATKEAARKKTCSECTHYTSKDENEGECPIAGIRLASADSYTCPQKAFEPRPLPN
jgi:rubrerythrin